MRGGRVVIDLARLVATSTAVASTSKRSEKVSLLADLLREVPPADAPVVVGFLVGSPRQGRVGIGWSTLSASSEVDPAPEPSLTVHDVDAAIDAALGDHDWHAPGAKPYLDYFELPGNERYYDFVKGPVHFFALDSDPNEADGNTSGSRQAQWLKSKLASASEPFKVVYFHDPPYSSGSEMRRTMRWPFRDWGADLVLTGHQHLYERLVIDGMTYVIDGLGGALNRFPFAATQPGSLVRYNATFGALFVEVFDGGKLDVTFRNTHGDVVDRFDLLRDCSVPRARADGGP